MSQIIIRPEPLPEPNGFQFFVNRCLSESPKMFLKVEQCAENLLAKTLLESGKIQSVFINENLLKINKTPQANWDEIFDLVERSVQLNLQC